MLAAYADLMDGVRSHYARREGDDWVAAFSAAMLMSLLLTLNISAFIIILDLLLHHELRVVSWIASNRGVVLPVPIAIAILHVLFAKTQGIYDRRGGPRSLSWARSLRIYVFLTACSIALALLGALPTVPFAF